MGPANLYFGSFGSVEPAYGALTSIPSGAVWTDVGAIADGTSVLLEVDQTYTEISAEQTIDPLGALLTKRTIQVTASLEEVTLANMTLAMNGLTSPSIQSGYSPDLNPIEHLWAKLKAALRRLLPASHNPTLTISNMCKSYAS